MTENYLYHYYDKNYPPFRTITSLPFDEAVIVYREWRENNPTSGLTTVEWYLNRRYAMEKIVRDKLPIFYRLGFQDKYLIYLFWYY